MKKEEKKEKAKGVTTKSATHIVDISYFEMF